MSARITTAVNVGGERRGERVNRTWVLVPLGCRGLPGPCPRLRLFRRRTGGVPLTLVLHRTASGSYRGSAAFFVPLGCGGRTYRHGSRAPYRISLRVTAAQMVDGVAFATAVKAFYFNPSRSDRTPCPLGPSHDAAWYAGRSTTPPPVPPAPAVIATPASNPHQFTFTDTTAASPGTTPIVSFAWDFGDPASGGSNQSPLAQPVHAFSSLGSHTVSVRVVDANGLAATAAATVVALP
jgi:hypothetical protein